ncbi:Mlo domain-containing protein [Cephalotus follicularis]|uniref:MLO-like protein n=1 Tax=Cephalotus follicularis TaxID=3775 RepID=A0A1Q3BD68_CEPFO|nr:Mlo domain-containing protein [Cephalotus follicularis]
MGGGEGGGTARQLDQTPTWAVASVCLVIIMISIILEKLLHLIGEYFEERRKKALYEALQKVKGELMVLGFISLILTFGQSYIARMCIPLRLADTMLPCPRRGGHLEATKEQAHETPKAEGGHHRRLLWYERRFLNAETNVKGCEAGHVPLISMNGLHQLHIFIFFLAVFHVIYSAITMALGRLKIRGWRAWERDAINIQESLNDPSRFRLTHETSFVRDHTSAWTKNPASFYLVCFFRQFFRSVRRADYLTMRHGFVSVHLAPGSKFDFQKYIKRSLEDDFKVVVGISPILWCSVVLFLLLDVSGWNAMFYISMFPLFVILAVGTKLQAIISRMALDIMEKHAVVQGIPLVQVNDRHFWFSWPQLVLHLIHFVLFQNAFEITYFFWIWYEFGLKSCFHQHFSVIIVRVALGVGVQFLCSYITLPLYALVTQMGSTMKKSIFDEQTSKALKQWHKKAVKKKNDGKQDIPTRKLGGSPGGSPDAHSSYKIEVPGVEADGSTAPQTANIMASVDIDGRLQQRANHDNGFSSGQRDLLS